MTPRPLARVARARAVDAPSLLASPAPRARRRKASVVLADEAAVVYPEAPLAHTPDLPVAPSRRTAAGALVRHRIAFDDVSIDPDVVRIVRRLTQSGYEAYLVGGCVRDLLLGRRPKDFDVATSAKPEEVRAVFRNSRIIGRRFRLVHVFFPGRKVVEVATFRRNPNDADDRDEAPGEEADLLIRHDNTFGTVAEDAVRRDFTVNALFYDVEGGEILDFFDGMSDIEGRSLRTVGDPVVRFREDPVRILRAVKFAGKLDIGIDPDVVDAIVATRDSLLLASRPRLFEEILRLLRGGAARRSMFLAWEMGLLHVLLPELATLLDDVDGDDGPSARVFRLLAELDRRTHERDVPFDDIVLWTLLLLEPLAEVCDGETDRMAAAMDFSQSVLERLAVPRRIADAMRRIVVVLPRLFAAKLGRFVRNELFEQALAVAEIRLVAEGRTADLARLQSALGTSRPLTPTPAAPSSSAGAQRRRRRPPPRRS